MISDQKIYQEIKEAAQKDIDRVKKLEETRALLKKQLFAKIENIRFLLTSAVDAYSAKDYAVAVDKYKAVLDLDSTNVAAKKGLKKAEKRYYKVLKKENKTIIKELLAEAKEAYKNLDPRLVYVKYKKVLEFDPENRKAKKALASIGDTYESEDIYDEEMNDSLVTNQEGKRGLLLDDDVLENNNLSYSEQEARQEEPAEVKEEVNDLGVSDVEMDKLMQQAQLELSQAMAEIDQSPAEVKLRESQKIADELLDFDKQKNELAKAAPADSVDSVEIQGESTQETIVKENWESGQSEADVLMEQAKAAMADSADGVEVQGESTQETIVKENWESGQSEADALMEQAKAAMADSADSVEVQGESSQETIVKENWESGQSEADVLMEQAKAAMAEEEDGSDLAKSQVEANGQVSEEVIAKMVEAKSEAEKLVDTGQDLADQLLAQVQSEVVLGEGGQLSDEELAKILAAPVSSDTGQSLADQLLAEAQNGVASDTAQSLADQLLSEAQAEESTDTAQSLADQLLSEAQAGESVDTGQDLANQLLSEVQEEQTDGEMLGEEVLGKLAGETSFADQVSAEKSEKLEKQEGKEAGEVSEKAELESKLDSEEDSEVSVQDEVVKGKSAKFAAIQGVFVNYFKEIKVAYSQVEPVLKKFMLIFGTIFVLCVCFMVARVVEVSGPKQDFFEGYKKQINQKIGHAKYFLDKGQSKEAFDLLYTVFEILPEGSFGVDIYYKITEELLSKEGNSPKFIKEVISIYENMIEKYGQTVNVSRAYLEMGDLYKKLNLYEDAIEIYKMLIANYPDSKFIPQAMLSMGRCQLNIGEYKVAKRTFYTLFEKYKDSVFANDAIFELADSFEEEAIAVRED